MPQCFNKTFILPKLSFVLNNYKSYNDLNIYLCADDSFIELANIF